MRCSAAALLACATAWAILFLAADRRAGNNPPPAPAAADRAVSAAPPEVAAIDDRSAAKDRLLTRLIAGGLRLADAVEAVLALNDDWPAVPPGWYDSFP